VPVFAKSNAGWPQGLRMTGVDADEIEGIRNEIEILVYLGDKMVKLIEFIEPIGD
jgi:hypothetical protein